MGHEATNPLRAVARDPGGRLPRRERRDGDRVLIAMKKWLIGALVLAIPLIVLLVAIAPTAVE
jgi:hypothetical protein